MQLSNIQHQHFWVELILGLVILQTLLSNSFEKGLISSTLPMLAIFASRTIHRGRQTAAKRTEIHRTILAEIARKEEKRQLKRAALLQAQKEATQKYLE